MENMTPPGNTEDEQEPITWQQDFLEIAMRRPDVGAFLALGMEIIKLINSPIEPRSHRATLCPWYSWKGDNK